MAQKTGQEEAEFKSQSVPETLSLCVNNCGVTGNPSTNNMCQNCFTSTTTTTSSASSILSSSSSSLTSSGTLKFEKSLRSTTVRQPRPDPDLIPKVDLAAEMTLDTVVAKRVVNRCSGCKRKVGLTGFRCRCGEFFCSEHRYSDRHECSYDYKAAGRVAIARENPVVRAAKIVKV